MRDTWPRLACSEFPPIERGRITTLQLNLGYRCNLSCIHCHVNAGPRRTETMDRDTMQLALEVGARLGVGILDLTGGSPEMNVDFRWLVETAKARGLHVMDRLNPTIMQEPGYAWVGEFLAAHEVEAIASLPCYSQANVEEQRGEGTFESSITALQRLNALGYAMPDSKLILNLVYNPNGAFLPPAQGQLEREYRHLLGENFGIRFNHLYALANMPIQRFGSWLLSKGKFDDYMATLRNAHQDANLDAVMCRSTLSVGHDGKVYDCDFNQMLKLPLAGRTQDTHLRDLLAQDLPREIGIAGHCFGCTAGQGSSCGGALH
ncbi:MAG: arsenosugar biosynthesis radical SAM (seleno)protein ArsS [Dokdonella sp.]|uniref:arsenosugar biosynthesis radical SAM (seleno)protein ArsS n=1 Tax=Dokdonella sp. TaxID=2291710 RepID=UPI002C76EE2D|nr:arsenosugar biosynthesis radical SAM protein ArsS [Xanthomonadales bacterium]MBL0221573.1 arsenosugar biosynthesis radical SAM protein ArsS [Xanthomonadales bacterium]HQW75560.1 arsenosugar biosynthesis radical SAM protein ArsS [Dokdonella sp.]HQZ62178.1 arsenosugar biosynthesis radical SAM protein ArsS [Dokdonella sp.]